MADPNAEGWASFWRLYESGSWEPWTRNNIQRFCAPGKLYVDFGAWIGPTVLWALETGVDIIAIEPDPVARAELLRRVQDHRVEVWDCAVGTETGTTFLAPKPHGQFGDSESRLASRGLRVPMHTLETILGGRVPAFVKIDVEGYEQVLMPQLAPWLASIGAAVQVSYHGVPVDQAVYAAFSEVSWPDHAWGDVVAVP